LLKWSLAAIAKQDFYQPVEINILDDGSTDNLDEVLAEASYNFEAVNKYVLTRSAGVKSRRFNCPAEAYNILVKLAKYNIIYKTDPECVILNSLFLREAVSRVLDYPRRLVMPFTNHCYEFGFDSLEEIEKNYRNHHYATHITKESASRNNVYYQAVCGKPAYLSLGGVDERFMGGIGWEDEHFLYQWRKHYGVGSVYTLIDSECVHLFHGGMAPGPQGLPSILMDWVEHNARLGRSILEEKPNQGREFGKLYPHITLTRWAGGALEIERAKLSCLDSPAPLP
jgi:hypothetical protein